MLVSSISPSTTRFFGNYPANINVLLAFCWQKGERFTQSKFPLAVHQFYAAKYATSKHIQTPCQVNHWVTPKTTRSKGAVVVSISPEVELTSLASVGPPATLGPLDELRMWGFSNLRWGGLASQPYHGKILCVVEIHRHLATFCRPWTFISTCVVFFWCWLDLSKTNSHVWADWCQYRLSLGGYHFSLFLIWFVRRLCFIKSLCCHPLPPPKKKHWNSRSNRT